MKIPEATEIGIGVFFVGVGLLIFTFYLAYTTYTNPKTLLPFCELMPTITGEGILGLLGNLSKILGYIIPTLLFFVMSFIAGKIAMLGIEMYKSKKAP